MVFNPLMFLFVGRVIEMERLKEKLWTMKVQCPVCGAIIEPQDLERDVFDQINIYFVCHCGWCAELTI